LLALLAPFLLLTTAAAQQFVDETKDRFPNPNPKDYTHQVTLGDVDGDGDLDIVFANANAYEKPAVDATVHQSRLYINDGKGVFTDETAARLDLEPGWYRDADLADLDADNDLDLILAGAFGFGPKLLINDGKGNFTDETAGRAPAYDGWWGAATAVGDVDMDGDLDLYFTNAGTKMFGPPGGQDRLWINAGGGLFTDETVGRMPVLKTRATIQVRFCDIDNDTDLDVVVTNRDIKSNLLLNDSSGHFSDGSFLLVPDGKHSYEIQAGDLTGDSLIDLLVANGHKSSSTKELLMINSVDGASTGFVDGTDLLMGAAGVNPKADDNETELFDVDADGDFDVIVAAISPGAERVLINDGNGFLTLQEGAFGAVSDATLDLEIGDLDGDGRADIVTAQGESGSYENRVYMNTGPKDDKAPLITHVNAAGPLGAYLGPVPIVARVSDANTSDTGPRILEATVNGTPMRWAGGSLFWGLTGDGLIKEAFTVKVTATDPLGNASTSGSITISPRHPLDVFEDGAVDDKDLGLMVDHLVDKGGLGPEGDIDGDGEVSLSDAQLLATGVGGLPVLARVHQDAAGTYVLIGGNFGAAPTVSAAGATFTVTDSGPISMLATADGEVTGKLTVDVGGVKSNALGLAVSN